MINRSGAFLSAAAGILLIAASAVDAVTGYWVVTPNSTAAQVTVNSLSGEIVLANGIIERKISIAAGNGVTTSYKNLYTGVDMLYNAQTEAVVGLDGTNYGVGGSGPAATTFRYDSCLISDPVKPYEWTPKRGAQARPWPPLGKALTLVYRADPSFAAKYQNVKVRVNMELYQGIPVICKKVTVVNNGTQEVKVTCCISEVLAVPTALKNRLYLESDFHGATGTDYGSDNVFRRMDNARTTRWVDTLGCSMVRSMFDIGPDRRIAAGQSFTGFRTFELVHSVDSTEWKEMEIKQMYRTVAPQITENPVFMHLISDNAATVRAMIDSCASVGFEMIIQSFGSGVNVESTDATYIANHKTLYDYGDTRGIEMGAYTMLTVGSGGADGTNPTSQQWGTVRCLASAWMDRYWSTVSSFVQQTGLDMMEVDGTYPMFTCVSTSHAHHDGLNDSRERQWAYSTVSMNTFFRNRNMYTNQPDWLYLNGASKCGIGYWEDTWSLARQQQLLAGRLYIYDGTYQKTPAMGWTFVPIDVYHSGGTAASFEPLSQNIADYEWVLAQNFMSGVIACYRGSRLFDNAATKAVVKKWVDFYKKYRDILNADVIHIRRPQASAANHARATGIDALMHANAQLKVKGLVAVWNQTDARRTDTICVPMFYTGLTDMETPPPPLSLATPQATVWPAWPPTDPFPVWAFAADLPFPTPGTPTANRAMVHHEELDSAQYTIDSRGNIRIPVTLAAMSYTWYAINEPAGTRAVTVPERCAEPRIEIRNNAIFFRVTAPTKVTIAIYASDGRKVADLFNRQCAPASYRVVWDNRGISSAGIASGCYFCRVVINGRAVIKPLPVVR